jgi:hypothetical protein
LEISGPDADKMAEALDYDYTQYFTQAQLQARSD